MIGYIIGAAIVGLVIGVVLMFIYCNISKQTVNDAKREAESIKNEAEESAARKKREALLEAKEAGKIKHIGITSHGLETVEKAVESGKFENVSGESAGKVIIKGESTDITIQAIELP